MRWQSLRRAQTCVFTASHLQYYFFFISFFSNRGWAAARRQRPPCPHKEVVVIEILGSHTASALDMSDAETCMLNN